MIFQNLFKKKMLAAGVLVALAMLAQAAVKSYADNKSPAGDSRNWTGYNRSLDSQRFSPLVEITPANVSHLKTKCVFDLGEKMSFQNGPIAVNGLLYVTTENDTYAIDGATCEQVWKFHRNFTSAPESLHVNRGATFSEGRIFRGSNDGFLLALDAKTGKLVWQARAADPAIGESLPAVPVVWNHLVFIGQAGGDNVGVRGRMMAFQETDGQKVWSFDLAPMKGPASETWPESTPQVPRTGAATWTSYTIDEMAGTVLVPVGNAAPDFLKSARPGLNLYSDSVVILDARTGALQSWFQLTKNDTHDWDVASAPVLFRGSNGHKKMAEAGKDGLLHLIDLDLKATLFEKATTSRFNVFQPISTTGTRFCPGTQGGSEWNGAAFDSSLQTLFVPSVDWCSTVTLSAEQLPSVAKAGDPFTGAEVKNPFGTMDARAQWKGWLKAFNANDGSLRWQYQSITPLVAAVTPTAGGLIFAGDLDGRFMAFNSQSGKLLFSSVIGEPIGGGIISYEVAGHQKVAIAAGLQSKTWQTKTNSSRIVVYGLE
jgi:alcohol dehydrogenase (cytochrome c)